MRGVSTPAPRPQNEADRDKRQSERQRHPERQARERQLRGLDGCGGDAASVPAVPPVCVSGVFGFGFAGVTALSLSQFVSGGQYCAAAADVGFSTIQTCFATVGFLLACEAEEEAYPTPPNDARATTIRPEGRVRVRPAERRALGRTAAPNLVGERARELGARLRAACAKLFL